MQKIVEYEFVYNNSNLQKLGRQNDSEADGI